MGRGHDRGQDASQFAVLRPGMWSKCQVFPVTSVRSRAIAMLAIRRPGLASGRPLRLELSSKGPAHASGLVVKGKDADGTFQRVNDPSNQGRAAPASCPAQEFGDVDRGRELLLRGHHCESPDQGQRRAGAHDGTASTDLPHPGVPRRRASQAADQPDARAGGLVSARTCRATGDADPVDGSTRVPGSGATVVEGDGPPTRPTSGRPLGPPTAPPAGIAG
jgi:hypothetical protein